MKQLRKLLLMTVFFTVISPVSVFAEPNTPPKEDIEETETKKEEEKSEAKEEEENKDEEENKNEGVKVDEDNEDPFLYNGEEENLDQSKREKEIIKKPIETPASVTGEKYQGSGTVTDFTTTGGKAFYTVKGTDNTVFYIVIDMDKTEDNVYFLSEINGEELTLDEVSSQPQTQQQVEEPQMKEENEVVEKDKTSNLTFWLMFFVASLLFIGYQLFFGKLKNLNPLSNKNKKTESDKKLEPEKVKETKGKSKTQKEKEGSIDVYAEQEAQKIQLQNKQEQQQQEQQQQEQQEYGRVADEEDEQ